MRGQPFRLLLPLPYPLASTSRGEGLPSGLLEDSCGQRKPKSKRNRLNGGTFMPASEYETLIRRRCGEKQRLRMHTIIDKSMICAVSRVVFSSIQ